MQQLSAQDASFVYLEAPHTSVHIGSVAIYDPSTAPGGFVRFKDILAFIAARLKGARYAQALRDGFAALRTAALKPVEANDNQPAGKKCRSKGAG